MNIKPDDVFAVQLVMVRNIGVSVVKIGAESLYRQVTKSRDNLRGRDNIFSWKEQ